MNLKMAALVAALFAFTSLGADEAAETGNATLDDLRSLAEVFIRVRDHFVEPVDEHELLLAAIHGMIGELDPWSEFLDADAFRSFDDNAAGRYGGIGVHITVRRRRLYVESVTPTGPAERAGIRAGDLILAVDGEAVRGRRLDAATDALLGQPGSQVVVRFQTPGSVPRNVTLVRAELDVTSVFSLLDKDIAIVRITHFTRQTADEFERVVDGIGAATEANLRGLVIDLRSNPGGVIQPAVNIADGFLAEGLIVYTESRYTPSQLEIRASPQQWWPAVPVVILVDRRTASAAEVLAGALKDNGRAVVLGEQTFGKGSIQSLLNLSNGAVLKLTTAYYYTPSGSVIHGRGIEPDESLDSTFPDLSGQVAPFETDMGIRAAIRRLNGEE